MQRRWSSSSASRTGNRRGCSAPSATRKLGDIDKGIGYYHQALAIDPGYTKVREYLGEAYLQKGDVVKAKEQLTEIADRCGGPCDDYELLVKAIAAHVTGEKTVDW
jgi:tetratricopeptide (TPR) repeat protein